VLKISKDQVKSISKEKKRIEDENTPSEIKEDKERKGEKAKKEEKKIETSIKHEKTTKLGQEEIDFYKKRKAELRFRLDELQRLYAEEKDKIEREKIKDKMIAVTKEFHNLQKEVTEKNNGVLPEWWKEE
jgi:hypothetical protein